MRHVLTGLTAFGSCLLLAGGAFAVPRVAPVALPPAAVQPATPVDAASQELKRLLERMTQLSDFIARNPQSPQLWRYYLDQGEVLMQLALRSEPKERDNLLRMAVDSYYGAAVQSPTNEASAYQQLVQLPGLLTQLYPGHALITCAARQEIQADYMRTLSASPDKPEKAQQRLSERLFGFAQQYPTDPEAPKVVMEAGQLCESLGQKDQARTCYRYLCEHFASNPLARKARGAQWRLGQGGESLDLDLPLLFSLENRIDPLFHCSELRGKVVVVYFWATTSGQTSQDFQVLKQLTDRYQERGLEVVYVNLDQDAGTARAFLSGQLTAGVHLHQQGGLESPIAERYGFQNLPQIFLVGRDGMLIRHSLQASQLEPEVSSRLSR